MPALLLLALSAAASAAPDGRPLDVAVRVAMTDVGGVACTDTGCRVLVGTELRSLDPDTLTPGELLETLPPGARLVQVGDTAEVLVPCGGEDAGLCRRSDAGPVPVDATEESLPRTPQEVAALWNARHAHEWRVPFLERSPSPTGGLLFLLRSGTPRLMRTGGPIRAAELAAPAPLFPWQPAVALHPTGTEAFVLPWPGGTLTAVDARRMAARWTIELQPAAQGLFVDGTGRLLVAEEAGTADGSELHPDGTRRATPAGDVDPTGDLALALSRDGRPDAQHTVVVDLSVPRLVWREDGRYLSLVPRDGHRWLLATEHALVLLAPTGPEPSPTPE